MKAPSIAVASAPQISQSTVAVMINAFESLFQGVGYGYGMRRYALLDVNKLSTALFGMGFDKEFLDKCQYLHGWNFSSILPSVYDGSFYGESVFGRSKGQQYLLGFATFLCGVTEDNGLYTDAAKEFLRMLRKDGFEWAGRQLRPVDLDTAAVPQELKSLSDKSTLITDLTPQLESTLPVAVLFLDLDHFKDVNDKFGHGEGDRCLLEFVRLVAETVQHKGKLYRIGGDEFAVMLLNSSKIEAGATAERIRAAIDSLRPYGTVKVTVSIGSVASHDFRRATPEALVEAADECMYIAKFTGKNRVCCWPPNTEEAAIAKDNRSKSKSKR